MRQPACLLQYQDWPNVHHSRKTFWFCAIQSLATIWPLGDPYSINDAFGAPNYPNTASYMRVGTLVAQQAPLDSWCLPRKMAFSWTLRAVIGQKFYLVRSFFPCVPRIRASLPRTSQGCVLKTQSNVCTKYLLCYFLCHLSSWARICILRALLLF